MTTPLDRFVDEAEHDARDHSVVPGVMTPASHAATNHAGLPGVGDLTVAAHAATNHAGLPGVGDLSTAAHASLDHSSIPGVGVRGTRVLGPPSTIADIQTALNDANVHTVFLLPGNYAYTGTGLFVPNGKALLGLSGHGNRQNITPSYSTSTHAVFQCSGFVNNGSTSLIQVGMGSRLANVVIAADSMTGSGSARAIHGANGNALIENCIVDRWMEDGTGTGSAVFVGSGDIVRNVLVYRSRGHCFEAVNGNDRAPTTFENCVAYNGLSDGFNLSSAVFLTGCFAGANTGAGFRGQILCTYQKLSNCQADLNGASGFNWTISSAGDGTIISNCYAVQNTGHGYHCTAATPSRPGVIGCGGRANTLGNFNVGGGWNSLSNWNG